MFEFLHLVLEFVRARPVLAFVMTYGGAIVSVVCVYFMIRGPRKG